MTKITKEMIEAGVAAATEEDEGYPGYYVTKKCVLRSYLAMKALDPEIERLIDALRQIALGDRAPEFEPTDFERAAYWRDAAVYCRKLARNSLDVLEEEK